MNAEFAARQNDNQQVSSAATDNTASMTMSQRVGQSLGAMAVVFPMLIGFMLKTGMPMELAVQVSFYVTLGVAGLVVAVKSIAWLLSSVWNLVARRAS